MLKFVLCVREFSLKGSYFTEDVSTKFLRRKRFKRGQNELMLPGRSAMFQFLQQATCEKLSCFASELFTVRLQVRLSDRESFAFFQREFIHPRLLQEANNREADFFLLRRRPSAQHGSEFFTTQRGSRDAEFPLVIQTGHRARLRSQLRDSLNQVDRCPVRAQNGHFAMAVIVERAHLQERTNGPDDQGTRLPPGWDVELLELIEQDVFVLFLQLRAADPVATHAVIEHPIRITQDRVFVFARLQRNVQRDCRILFDDSLWDTERRFHDEFASVASVKYCEQRS